MTPDERNLIGGLFSRLKDADASAGPKDREAEDFIRQNVAALPSTPYLLVQTVLVQEHALANAQARIAELEKQVEAAKSAQPAGGSFLGGLADKLGPWGRRADQQAGPGPGSGPGPAPMPQPPQPMAPQPGYAAYASTAAMAPSAGGGFLRSALTTAAGVAGGALLFQGIESLLGHNAGAFGPGLGAGYGGGFGGGFGGGGTTINETVNNYYGNDPDQGTIPADDQQAFDQKDPGSQDTDYASDDSGDFGGGDFGGGSDDNV
jgi:uncharacterized protein